ncbi:hypothetical protein AURDEDRAFT_126994 [Auricularia subglabra TFB-10046 SS5]|nr:hypothetical protein AURDEDRAFT_126994 [Auricularia subglabra TFB-10046 SS5]
MESTLALHDIPVVRHNSDVPDWHASSWDAIPGPLRMRVLETDRGCDSLTLVTLVTEADAPQRRVREHEFANYVQHDGTPLTQLAFLAPRLTYIRLEKEFLSGLLLFGCALPALRRLWIDLPHDWSVRGIIMPVLPVPLARQDQDSDSGSSVDSLHSYAESHPAERACTQVQCTALENLTVYAMEKPMEVSPLQVYLLAGVRFRAGTGEDSERVVDLAPGIFSSVDHRDFKGKNSFEVREVGLPIELVVDIMKYLPPPDLRRTAGACRQYKAVAYHDAGLYISTSIHVLSLEPVALSKRLVQFSALVAHAVRHELRLRLNLHCEIYERFGRSWEAFCELPPLEDLFATITVALPVLVDVTFRAPDFFRKKLYPHLCVPAPQLRRLIFFRGSMDGDMDAYACPIPVSLFAGLAPKLSHIELHHVVPSELPIPAFENARSLIVFYKLTTPNIRFARAFPSLIRLGVSFKNQTVHKSVPHFDFRGLELRHLTVYDDLDCRLFPEIESALALRDIPFVRHNSRAPDWCVSSWDAIPGAVRARVHNDGGIVTLVTLVAEAPRRRRQYDFGNWERYDGTPLNELAFLAPRLSMRVRRPIVRG